jgi:zinc transporter 5/7
MKGVLLHILADTLGSVGVVISALLMRAFGWMRADPVCSIFIAVLVAASVWGLLRDSARVLMMRTPIEFDDEQCTLDKCYAQLRRYHPAILGIQEPRFWTLCADTFAGSIKIEVRSGLTGIGGAVLSSQSSSPLQFAIQSNQQQEQQYVSKVLHDRDQFANHLVRYAQQVFGAVGVRHLYVQIDYTADDTISGGGLLNNDLHHLVNDTQRNNYVTPRSLLDQQQQQQLQTYNQNYQQQQQQQQQQYTNPLLMM